MKPVEVVDRYFRAMQAGPAGADELFSLFAEDAVYIEPFSGQSLTHRGRPEIEAYLRGSWEQGPPDLELTVNRVDVDGEVVRSEWTCSSPAFEAPVRGIDECTVRQGQIQRLEVRFP